MITFRRMYLDEWLERSKPLMHGKVLDIGGKKDNKRGNFRPPIEKVSSWEYVNIDKITAKYDNGVFNVSVPRVQPVEPEVKKIKIK